ncbi:hypothetical protein EXN66_Car019013 [Channa argus]|uniref:Uncharacterized protein n=1 Tax=Channa argus TaxID=215402 RepID=A0A6G1QL94_CHAAH|nr:hypothetical protein EXN66_Car019013 [Channa argus]
MVIPYNFCIIATVLLQEAVCPECSSTESKGVGLVVGGKSNVHAKDQSLNPLTEPQLIFVCIYADLNHILGSILGTFQTLPKLGIG